MIEIPAAPPFEICDGFAVSIAPGVRERINRLKALCLSDTTARTCVHNGWDLSYTREVEREYLKFVCLIMLEPGRDYGMCGPVDLYWHEHIIDTICYAKMCDEIIGRFLHHSPGIGRNRDSAQRSYIEVTYPAIQSTFVGRISPIWPDENDSLHFTCSACNSCDRIARPESALQ